MLSTANSDRKPIHPASRHMAKFADKKMASGRLCQFSLKAIFNST